MLETTGLGLSAGNRELVRALDLSLAPGQCWALLGRNGSGKSSLILALAGLREPQSGKVALDGTPLAAYRRAELARRIAVLLFRDDPGFGAGTEPENALNEFLDQAGRKPCETAASSRHWYSASRLA